MKKFLSYIYFVAMSAMIFIFLRLFNLYLSNNFTSDTNTKALWGMLGNNNFATILSIIFLAIFLVLVYIYRHRSIYWPSVFVVAGTFSNIYDRLSAGQIKDYIVLRFTAFNLADITIAIGIFCFFWQILSRPPEDKS